MSSTTDVEVGKPVVEKSTAELVNDLTSQFTHLARTEVRLAMREMRTKAKHARVGAASIGMSGVLAFYGGALLLTCLVLLLALVVPDWAAALIVGGAVLAIAGVAALVARSQFRKGAPMPSEAVDSARQDLDVVRKAAKR